jgi:Ion channel
VPEALATRQGGDNDRHQSAAEALAIESEACAVTTLDLLHNLTVAIALVSTSVSIQVTVTLLLLKLFARMMLWGHSPHGYLKRALVLTCLILVVISDHLAQIHVWGSAFYFLSYFSDFWRSQYFAAQTYTTLGYGNILLPPERSMLAGWLALTGLLMIGWSTALFAYLITRYHDAQMASDRPPDGQGPGRP